LNHCKVQNLALAAQAAQAQAAQIRSLQRATQIKADTLLRESNAHKKVGKEKKTKQGAHVKEKKEQLKLEHLKENAKNNASNE
jgi:hypothetical protein